MYSSGIYLARYKRNKRPKGLLNERYRARGREREREKHREKKREEKRYANRKSIEKE
jgi:hypothetical protein